jgi:hypothetical protein
VTGGGSVSGGGASVVGGTVVVVVVVVDVVVEVVEVGAVVVGDADEVLLLGQASVASATARATRVPISSTRVRERDGKTAPGESGLYGRFDSAARALRCNLVTNIAE